MLQHLVGLSTERSDIHASRVATHPPLLCGSGWCGRCDWQAKSSLAVFFKLDTSLFFFFHCHHHADSSGKWLWSSMNQCTVAMKGV